MDYISEMAAEDKKVIERFISDRNEIKKELEALAWKEMIDGQEIDKKYQKKLQSKHDKLDKAIKIRTEDAASDFLKKHPEIEYNED